MNKIDPLQPYFVLNTKVYYRMASAASSVVAHFYQFTYTEKNPVINGVVPDGAADLIFDIDSGIATIAGSVKNVIETPFQQGHTYFGVRFRPGVFERFGEISASELVGISVPLSDILKNSYSDKTVICGDFEQKTEGINDILSALFCDSKNDTKELFDGLLIYIYEHGGDITIRELEERFFYSRRHLLRVFKQRMGIDIKLFSQIVRFQSVLSELNSGRHLLLTQIAQDHGYYDQTHFQKEFRRFALLSPGAYKKILEKNGYRSRIHRC